MPIFGISPSLLILLSIGAVLVAVLIWISGPIYKAYQTRRTGDHPSESVFRVSSRSDEMKPFPTVLDDPRVGLSCIVPAYNEEERLSAMMDEAIAFLQQRTLGDQHFTWEIIIVDDGSKDRTVDVAMSYVDKYGPDNVRVLKLSRNHGKGGAVRKGMMRARGEYMLMVDADGATRFSDLEFLEKRMRVENGYGIAVGSRAHLQDDEKANRKWYRTVLMMGFHGFVSLLCGGHGIRDTQCGFKLFTRRAAQVVFTQLHIERWAFDVELVLLAFWLNIPITEVAVNWQEIDGSKLDLVSSTIDMARDLLLIRMCYTLGIWRIQEDMKNPVAC